MSSEARSLSPEQVMEPRKPCDTCSDIDPLRPVEPREREVGSKFILSYGAIVLFQPLGAYKTSAELGCPTCRLLAAVFDHFWPGLTRDTKTRIFLHPDDLPQVVPEVASLRVCLYNGQALGQKRGVPHVPVRPDISLSHSSPEAFDFLRRNLAECTGEHAFCNAESSGVMPKRLIHIKNAHHAALVEATDGSEHANAIYAALSYCWGGVPGVKAEKSNLSYLMENGFLIDSLPIVWQETIGLCRKLCLSYLWIDALCIVQDDEVDWAGESVHMGHIYENAYLTIAPATSGSVDTSFLGSKPDPSREPVEFEVLPATSGRPATTVFAREIPRAWHYREDGYTGKDPWRLRGWTLQEQILSRRLVVFGAQEMQWRCKTTSSCECQDNILYSAWPRDLLEDGGHISREERELQLQLYWRYDVLGRFGPRQFTYPEDIFSAMSGIAQIFARATGWTYVAGMWKEHLLFGMCWFNTFVEGLEPSYRVYTAPTFSWASVNGIRRIHMWLHDDKFTQDAEVVDANMELKYAGAPFSTLVDGCVVLRGQLALASLEYANGEYRIVPDSSTQGQDSEACREELEIWHDSHIQAVPVATLSPQGNQDKVLWTGTRASKAPDGSCIARLGAPPESGGCTVWMLLLGTCIQRIYDGEDVQCVLVLGKSIRRPGAYERLGLVYNADCQGRPWQLRPMENRGRTETLTIV